MKCLVGSTELSQWRDEEIVYSPTKYRETEGIKVRLRYCNDHG